MNKSSVLSSKGTGASQTQLKKTEDPNSSATNARTSYEPQPGCHRYHPLDPMVLRPYLSISLPNIKLIYMYFSNKLYFPSIYVLGFEKLLSRFSFPEIFSHCANAWMQSSQESRSMKVSSLLNSEYRSKTCHFKQFPY